MLFRSILSALVVVSALAAPARAQNQEPSPYESCVDKAKAEAAMLACAKAELARNEARLAAAEAKILAAMPADKRSALEPLFKAAGEAWRAFRVAQCAWERAAAQGENADFADADCQAIMTDARAGALETRAEPPATAPKEQ